MKIKARFFISLFICTAISLFVYSIVFASNTTNVIDGDFEQSGHLVSLGQSVDNTAFDDPIHKALAEILSDPKFFLSSSWNISGNVNLIRDGENWLVELIQENETKLAQLIILDSSVESLDFDLTVVQSGSDDSLEVFFGDTIIGSISLSSFSGNSVSFSLLKFAAQSNYFSFVFKGSLADPAIVRLDNIRITGPGIVNVLVPDVIGLLEDNAKSLLIEQGLKIGEILTRDDSAVSGTVLIQFPNKGSKVFLGDEINLVVSKGSNITLISVPNAVGMQQEDAIAAITGAGLVIGTVVQAFSDTIQSGLVISENPPAGTQVSSGSTVDLIVSKGPKLDIPGDLDGDGVVSCSDLAIIKASFGKRTGQTGFDARADVNQDGVVNVYDLGFVSRQLSAGTKCS